MTVVTSGNGYTQLLTMVKNSTGREELIDGGGDGGDESFIVVNDG